jgi:hypothetical protein
MERKKITSNTLTPKEEEKVIANLEKPKLKHHRLTIDIPTKLYEPLQTERVKDGYTTLSSAILDLIRKYVNA